MAKTDIKIVATSTSDRTVNTTISDINPELQPTDALTLARKLNALTSNTYVKTNRIETTELDSEDDKTVRTPTIRVGQFYNTETGESQSNVIVTDLTEFSVDINTLTPAKGNTRFLQNFTYSDQSDPLSATPFLSLSSSADDFTPNFQGTWYSKDASGGLAYQISYALHQRVVRDIDITVVMPADDTYAEFRKTFTVHFINPT